MPLKNSVLAHKLLEGGSMTTKYHIEPPLVDTVSSTLNHISKVKPLLTSSPPKIMTSSSTVESPPLNNTMTSNVKSLSPINSTQNMKSSPTSDPVSTGNVKALSPYWLESCVEKSKKLLSSIGIDFVASDSTSSSSSSPPMEPNSWFTMTTMNITNPLNKNSPKTFWPSLLSSHVDKWGSDATPKESRRSKTLRIYPTVTQKRLLRGWMNDARLLYNTSVNEIISTTNQANKYSIRNDLVIRKNTNVTDPKILLSMERTPKDIRAKAVFEACAAHDLSVRKMVTINPKYVSLERVIKAETKKKDKLEASFEKKRLKLEEEIEKFKDVKKSLQMRKDKLQAETEKYLKAKENLVDILSLEKDLEYTPKFMAKSSNLKLKSLKNQYDHIFIPKTAVKIRGRNMIVYPKYNLGDILLKKNIREITSDFQIRWTRRLDTWHIITSEVVKVEPKSENGRTIALDPGIRTFLTGLGSDGRIHEIGKDWHLNKKIRDRISKMDRGESIRLEGLRGDERYTALKAKRSVGLHRRKLHHLIDDLHKKSAKFLTDNYDVIVLPKLRVKSLLRRSGTTGSLGSKTNRHINVLSHGKFHEYLSWRCMILGKIVIDQNEAYTTKTCYKCGIINEIGSSKRYKCEVCNNVCDRDIQSSYNIMTRYMSSYSSTRGDDDILSLFPIGNGFNREVGRIH